MQSASVVETSVTTNGLSQKSVLGSPYFQSWYKPGHYHKSKAYCARTDRLLSSEMFNHVLFNSTLRNKESPNGIRQGYLPYTLLYTLHRRRVIEVLSQACCQEQNESLTHYCSFASFTKDFLFFFSYREQ